MFNKVQALHDHLGEEEEAAGDGKRSEKNNLFFLKKTLILERSVFFPNGTHILLKII